MVALIQQVDGHQSGLPVVAVNDVGEEAQMAGGLDDRPGEEGEALGVVIVAVEAAAFEVILVVHEIVGHAVPLKLKETAVGVAPGQMDMEILKIGHLAAPVVPDALIKGEDDPYVMAKLRHGLGQGTGHIGQTAGLDEGGYLRGCKENVHKQTPFLEKLKLFHSLPQPSGRSRAP